MKRRRQNKTAPSDTPVHMLRDIEATFHRVRPPSSFRHNLFENLSLAAKHKATGEPIIGESYPKDQPFLIAMLLGFGAIFLTILFFILRPRDMTKTESSQVLAT